ncbi:MAG: DUF485 domain-containing protein [Burkholderiales bacterium]|nr:DUF485 domain-containing protein [Phycisphaerae bacterium]
MSDPGASHDAHHRSPNQELGMVLFIIYFALYAGFIAITVYDYKLLGKELFGGINLAIGYGMGLIIAAVALAILYAWLAKPDPVEPNEAAEI